MYTLKECLRNKPALLFLASVFSLLEDELFRLTIELKLVFWLALEMTPIEGPLLDVLFTEGMLEMDLISDKSLSSFSLDTAFL